MNQLEKDCCKYAENKGWEAIKLETNLRVGLPDRMFLGPERKMFFVETKKPNEPLRGAQRRTIKKFAELGWTVHVVDDFEIFVDIFRHYRRYG